MIPPDVLPPPPPPAVLACGAATRFSMVTAPKRIAATATAAGYNLITSDDADVRGYAYAFEGDTLVAQRGDVPLFSGTPAEFTTIADGDRTLLGIANGTPAPASTTLVALDARLAPLGPPVPHDTWVGGIGSLARNDAGSLAFLATLVPAFTSETDVRIVGADGAPVGPNHVVIMDGESPTISSAGDNFLVVWNAYGTSSRNIHASVVAMTSDSFVSTIAPTTVSVLTADAFNARGAYAAASETYLIAWMQKPGDPLDHIFVSLRDRDLKEIGTPKEIGTGNQPYVIAGKDDFLVVWRIDAVRLGAARVKPDGTVTPVPIEGTARDAISMDLVVRAGQPALVWVERDDGGGATVRFDPLCSR